MSTTLHGRQSVVPRRRPQGRTQPDDRREDEPVLLRLPDLTSTITETDSQSYRVDEAEAAVAAPASSDETTSGSKRREHRSWSTVESKPWWQSSQGKLIVMATLIGGALLLFAFFGPSKSKPGEEPPVEQYVESDDRDTVPPPEDLVGPLTPVDSSEAGPKRLDLGTDGRFDYSRNPTSSTAPPWSGGPSGDASSSTGTSAQEIDPRARFSDRRAAPESIPTYRIPGTYSVPASDGQGNNTPKMPPGPELNRQSRRPLSLDYQSRLPSDQYSR